MPRKKTQAQTGLANVLFPSEQDQQVADSLISIPPEQRKLHTETYDYSVQTINAKLRDQSIYIPPFQRRYVWTDAQASRLIESLIIQCPIPVLYLNQDTDERLAVIDGNQRLTSIHRYFADEFPLKSLTAYPELEGNTFSELDIRFQRHIENRTLRCIVILKDTHPQVKFDVFERLNTGSVRLTPQEIRHAMYYGPLIQHSSAIAKETSLADMLDIKHDRRMKAEELVLRFLALNESLTAYRKPLSDYINTFCQHHRNAPPETLARFHEAFQRSLGGVKKIFGKYAFKVFDVDRNVYSNFNAALFDAEMLAASSLPPNSNWSDTKKARILHNLALAFEDDVFIKSISQATSDEGQLRTRVKTVSRLLESA